MGWQLRAGWHVWQSIGVKLAYVPIVRDQMAEQLQAGACHIIRSIYHTL